MRALSRRLAGACEHAHTEVCRCRCGGQFHGAGRVADVGELRAGDPHALKDAVPARAEEIMDAALAAAQAEVVPYGEEDVMQEQLRWESIVRAAAGEAAADTLANLAQGDLTGEGAEE